MIEHVVDHEPQPGYTTNNEAEHLAIQRAVKIAIFRGWPRLVDNGDLHAKIQSDSKLAINQLTGNWAIRADNLRPIAEQTLELLKSARIELKWVPRERIVKVLGH